MAFENKIIATEAVPHYTVNQDGARGTWMVETPNHVKYKYMIASDLHTLLKKRPDLNSRVYNVRKYSYLYAAVRSVFDGYVNPDYILTICDKANYENVNLWKNHPDTHDFVMEFINSDQ